MKKQYTVEPAYTGNDKVTKYIDGKLVSYTIMNYYDLSGYISAIEEHGFEYAEDVDKAREKMEEAKKEYEYYLERYEEAKKHALIKE